ncbi:DNA repair protein rad52 [Onygenales sp. PD_40]|nr:DNA repair protein rad52 [Onygenales sp. PD_40]KAK2805383.1 DNA repair protein rad52 [Onygenales sp. PD_10]
MPAPGDQHRPPPARMGSSNVADITTNPFHAAEHRMNQYTAQQIATLQSRLDKRLGPEYISSRQGPGGQRVHYLAAEKCINLANEVFGFNGWSSSIQNIQIDFVDENPNTAKISLGLSVIIRVTLKDGTYHEDIGYGHCENSKSKALAFEKAKKEGTTDGLKRALRTFGNVLGNCVYDKEYLSRVTKVKAAPSKWDVADLHRDADHAIKKEPNPAMHSDSTTANVPPRLPNPPANKSDENLPLDLEGEFGSDLFDEADFGGSESVHPDEVTLDTELFERPQPNQRQASSVSHPPQRNQPRPVVRQLNPAVTPSKPDRSMVGAPVPGAQPDLPPVAGDRISRPNPPPTTSAPHHTPSNFQTPSISRPQQVPRNEIKPVPMQQPNHITNLPPPLPNHQPKPNLDTTIKGNQTHSPTKAPSPHSSQIAEDKRPEDPVVGFYSARAADALRNNPYSASKSAPTFDPRFDSPSIRRTAGINHNTSAPVPRTAVGITPPQFTGNNAAPSASQVQLSSNLNTNAPGRGPGPIVTNNTGGFASPATRGPMSTSSYRPPTRITRSNAVNMSPATNAAPAPQQQQNINGKRPPLSDVTNTRATDDGINDPMKKSKVEGNNTATTRASATNTVQPHPHPQRPQQ